MSDNELKQFNVSRDPGKYHYTNQGSQEVLNEKNDYKAITNAFKVLQFSPAEVTTIWKIVASILWLGNINFKSEITYSMLFLYTKLTFVLSFTRRR